MLLTVVPERVRWTVCKSNPEEATMRHGSYAVKDQRTRGTRLIWPKQDDMCDTATIGCLHLRCAEVGCTERPLHLGLVGSVHRDPVESAADAHTPDGVSNRRVHAEAATYKSVSTEQFTLGL